ncbi:mitochondrial carrier [Daedaleopsis nitida]|nr:mitochondrial carrier [Daedaleopsis nitida]
MPSKSANSMIAGAGGGLVASVATCPLDVIKTKLQAQRAVHGHETYQGVVATVKNIVKHDGIRGMYRGLGPTILGYLPTWAIYFAVYDGIKRHFGEKPLNELEGVRHLYPAAQVKGYQPLAREHPWTLHILSAMVAGATSTICTNPLWVIKTRFMTQPRDEVRYKHTLDAALTIYRTEGSSAFFRGLLPSLLGITHVAVQFPLYEHLKQTAARGRTEPLTPDQILGCSAVAKMTASIVTYPHEVVRTRLQTERRLLDATSHAPRGGIIRTTKHILAHEGWRALYRGLSVNLVRTVPNSAVTMLTYEMLVRYLNTQAGFS